MKGVREEVLKATAQIYWAALEMQRAWYRGSYVAAGARNALRKFAEDKGKGVSQGEWADFYRKVFTHWESALREFARYEILYQEAQEEAKALLAREDLGEGERELLRRGLKHLSHHHTRGLRDYRQALRSLEELIPKLAAHAGLDQGPGPVLS